jgi:hypothetical protein
MFSTPEQAARARDRLGLAMFGAEFIDKCNFPDAAATVLAEIAASGEPVPAPPSIPMSAREGAETRHRDIVALPPLYHYMPAAEDDRSGHEDTGNVWEDLANGSASTLKNRSAVLRAKQSKAEKDELDKRWRGVTYRVRWYCTSIVTSTSFPAHGVTAVSYWHVVSTCWPPV